MCKQNEMEIVRNCINRDCSGLAETIAKMRVVINGYRWIPAGEWGSYPHDKYTLETLQSEIGWMIDELDRIATQGLKESGTRVADHIKLIEQRMYRE